MSMKIWGVCGLAVLALGAFARPAQADSELEQLRTQNAQLKAQIEALQRACPAAATQPVPAGSVPVATAPAAPATPPPAAPASPPPAAAVAPTAAVASPAPPPQAPEGYKLVKVDPQTEAQDAENCTKGLFMSSKDAPWKHEQAWDALSKNMRPVEVETTLGKNHTAINKRDRTLWEYGRCAGSPPQAYVVFDQDGLLFWQRPDF